jgi:8-oxo-dGTP diphosphatase
VIFDAAGRVLVVKENYDRRRYGFPGGRLDPGEAPHHTAIRETREETGVEIAIDHLIGLYRLEDGLTFHAFAATIVDGLRAVQDAGEIADVGWFEPSAIPSPTTNSLHYSLQDALRGARGLVRDGLPRIS